MNDLKFNNKIAVLLSTYNGETYIQDQIKSVLRQTQDNWILYIRDDGSTDNTISYINSFQKKYPNKIKILEDDLGNLKSARSFMHLLSKVQADYYMFCDQDDIWFPSKIEQTFKKMLEIERINFGKSILVFTDLTVVDSNLDVIDVSMWHFSKINPENSKAFYKCICNSTVTGCTMLFNNNLKNRVLPYPSEALMHDWWISIIASKIGIVEYLSYPTISYRQHEFNVLGAEKANNESILFKKKALNKLFQNNLKLIYMLEALPFKVNYVIFFIEKFKKYFLKSFNS